MMTREEEKDEIVNVARGGDGWVSLVRAVCSSQRERPERSCSSFAHSHATLPYASYCRPSQLGFVVGLCSLNHHIIS